MKNLKKVAILILVFALPALITACGNNDSGQQVDAQQQSEAEAVQSSIQAETDQVAAASEVIQTADTKASVDSLIGSWIDINTPERFANITKTDTEYQFEDNEGKYPATFIDGVLKVKASDSVTVDVHIDTETGHMLSVYDGNITEFSKK